MLKPVRLSAECYDKHFAIFYDIISAVIYSIAEAAKANNLKPYEYFEHLLTVIPEHMEDTDRSFLEELLPWSPTLPENIRKQNLQQAMKVA